MWGILKRMIEQKYVLFDRDKVCDYILFYNQSKFLSLNFKKKIPFFSVFENYVIREEQVYSWKFLNYLYI